MDTSTLLTALFEKSRVLSSDSEPVLKIPFPSPDFKGFQGGCSDGKRYYYQVLMHYELSDRSKDYSCIARVDLKTGEVTHSGVLSLGHANDVTYLREKHLLVIAENSPNPRRVYFVDPDTLTVVGSEEICDPIYALEYNELRRRYLVGLSGPREFRFLDEEFRPTEDFTHRTVPSDDRCVKQGICADDTYLYFILWDGRHKTEPDFQNRISVYDWSGAYCGTVNFDVGPNEPESLSIVNGEILAVVVHDHSPMIYRITPKLP